MRDQRDAEMLWNVEEQKYDDTQFTEVNEKLDDAYASDILRSRTVLEDNKEERKFTDIIVA